MQNTDEDYFVIKKNRKLINSHNYFIYIYIWLASYSLVWHLPGEE